MKRQLALRYAKGWVTIEQLRRYVELGAITEDDFREIVGE